MDRSREYINRSQTHECGNWDWGRAIPLLGIHKGIFVAMHSPDLPSEFVAGKKATKLHDSKVRQVVKFPALVSTIFCSSLDHFLWQVWPYLHNTLSVHVTIFHQKNTLLINIQYIILFLQYITYFPYCILNIPLTLHSSLSVHYIFTFLEKLLKVHKIENFFDSDFGICVISLLVMSKY